MIYGDYHTHTNNSHGVGSIEQNIAAAAKLGLKEIAITDHGFNQIMMGITANEFTAMRRVIDGLEDKYEVKVLLGVECNFSSLSGDIGMSDEQNKLCDVVAVGFHDSIKAGGAKNFFEYYLPLIFSARLTRMESKLFSDKFTKAAINGIKKHRVHFITHPLFHIPFDVKRVSQAAFDYGVAFELNGKRINLSENDVETLKIKGCDFIINSDAHKPELVGDVNKAIEFAKTHEISFEKIINWDKKAIFE